LHIPPAMSVYMQQQFYEVPQMKNVMSYGDVSTYDGSFASTCEGDSSSESVISYDTPFCSDHAQFPSTRENSPEPVWHRADACPWKELEEHVARQSQAQTHIRSHLRESSRERPQVQSVDPNPQFQMVQAMVLVRSDQGPGMPAVIQMPNAGMMPIPVATMPPAQHVPGHVYPVGMQSQAPPAHTPCGSVTPCDAEEEEEEVQSEGSAVQSKSNKLRGPPKGADFLKNMSDDKKEALCKYIYEFMKAKNLTNQEGYLFADVFSEVWKEMCDDPAQGWRVAQHRFLALLRSSPQYFVLFRRGIRVANQCGWFARKGEKMVRLVLRD